MSFAFIQHTGTNGFPEPTKFSMFIIFSSGLVLGQSLQYPPIPHCPPSHSAGSGCVSRICLYPITSPSSSWMRCFKARMSPSGTRVAGSGCASLARSASIARKRLKFSGVSGHACKLSNASSAICIASLLMCSSPLAWLR